MEIPATSSGPSTPKHKITYSRGIPHLTPVQEKVLEQQFPDRQEVHLEKQLSAGYSGAALYLLTFPWPGSNYQPVVAKFDHPVILRRERAAYVATIQDKLGSVAPNQSELIESEDGSSGLLIYSYVGIELGQTQSYAEYITKSKDSEKAIKALNRIFLDGLGRAAEGSEPEQISRQKYYDRLLPPHLHVTINAGNPPDAIDLQAGKLEQTKLLTLEVGQPVHLKGFKVHKFAKSTPNDLTLYDDLSPKVDGAPSRLNLKGVQAAPGEELPALSAIITATRTGLLDSFARDALPTFNIYAESFTAYGCTFPNPLYHFPMLLDTEERYKAKVAIMHGDLHLENILVDKYDVPWLIDFAKTGKGPVLFDLQYLEARILITRLFDSKTPLQKCAKRLVTVLEALQRETLPAIDKPIAANPPRGIDRNTYRLLVGMRRLARHYLVKETEWREYYRGLTLALLQILKFSDYPQSIRQLALIGAATTIQWAGIHEIKPVLCLTHPWRWWAATSLLAVLLVLSILGWRQYPTLLNGLGQTLPAPNLGTSATASIYSLATPVAGCMRAVGEIHAQALPTPARAYTSIVQRIKDRGVLLCGVEGDLPHFSYVPVDEQPLSGLSNFFANATGQDADFCRVVATSIFGDYRGRVAFTKLETGERFNALIDGTIDILIRNTTWTAERDIGVDDNPQGIDFAPVIFYDGQRFLAKDQDIHKLEDLRGKSVCVQSKTTTLRNTIVLSDELMLNLQIKSVDGNTQTVVNAYQNGDCAVMAGDTSQLATRSQQTLGKIMPDVPISFEPLAPAMVENSEWRDIVNYAIWATIYAEEIGVKQENVDESRDKQKSPPIRQQFLNSGNKIGQELGLGANSDFIYKIINQLGNYGEIYACNLGAVLPERGQNQPALWYDFENHIWRPNPGGLLISPPFAQ